MATYNLNWIASSDATSGVSHYRIYKDNVYQTLIYHPNVTYYIGTTAPTGTWTVSAVDNAGSESAKSSGIVYSSGVPVTPTISPSIYEFNNAFIIDVSSSADASVTQIEVDVIGEFEGQFVPLFSTWSAPSSISWQSPTDLITDQEFTVRARFKNAGGTVGAWSNTVFCYTVGAATTL